jgi:murein DD-endopeptidase / murein LD-carboxypeptidase
LYQNKKNIIYVGFCMLHVVSLLCGCAIFKKGVPKKEPEVFSGGVFSIPAKDTVAATPTLNKTNRKANALQIKFGKQLSVSPDSIKNNRLYGFIEDWLGIPYQWGGMNERGIDCSAFVQKLYKEVYDIHIPRTSLEQYYTEWVELYRNTTYLNEGDLVFFKTMNNNNAVTHVGFYLQNGYFVNASSSKGVSIAKLNDPYWKVKYRACGRLKSKFYAKR